MIPKIPLSAATLRALGGSIGRYAHALGLDPTTGVERVSPQLARLLGRETLEKVPYDVTIQRRSMQDPRQDRALLDLPPMVPRAQADAWARKMGLPPLAEAEGAMEEFGAVGPNLIEREAIRGGLVPSLSRVQGTNLSKYRLDEAIQGEGGAWDASTPYVLEAPGAPYAADRTRQGILQAAYSPQRMSVFVDETPGHAFEEHNFSEPPPLPGRGQLPFEMVQDQVETIDPTPNNVMLHTRGITPLQVDAQGGVTRPTRVIDEIQSTWAENYQKAQPDVTNLREMVAYREQLNQLMADLDDIGRQNPQAAVNVAATKNPVLISHWGDADVPVLRLLGDAQMLWEQVDAEIRAKSPQVQRPIYPRTADWARLGVKSEAALGLEEGATQLALLNPHIYTGRQYAKVAPFYGGPVKEALGSMFSNMGTTPQPWRAADPSLFGEAVELSPALKQIWERVGFPGGNKPIWTLDQGTLHLRALAQKAVMELQQAGIPAQLAFGLVASLLGEDALTEGEA